MIICPWPVCAQESHWRGPSGRHNVPSPPVGEKKATPVGRAPPSFGKKRPTRQQRGGNAALLCCVSYPIPGQPRPRPVEGRLGGASAPRSGRRHGGGSAPAPCPPARPPRRPAVVAP